MHHTGMQSCLKLIFSLLTAWAARSFQRLCFYRCLSVHGRACVVAPGGHAWLLPGEGWACVVALGGGAWRRGHVWQRGACMAKGGMCGKRGGMRGEGGHVWQKGGWCAVRDTAGHCAGGTHPTGMHSCF